MIARLAALAAQARVLVCVGDVSNVAAIDEAAAAAYARVEVLVEIDVGAGLVASRLRFAGLPAYHGPPQHRRDHYSLRATTGIPSLR